MGRGPVADPRSARRREVTATPSLRDEAAPIVVDAIWRDIPVGPLDEATAARAVAIARRNHVAARLARAAPSIFAAELERTQSLSDSFMRNLTEVSQRLTAAGTTPTLVKCPPPTDGVYSNFDLVVGRGGWDRAIAAVGSWAVRRSAHRLEPDKLLLHPRTGPSAHLHRDVSWFGVLVIPAEHLRTVPVPGRPWRVPAPSDELRILAAHALFQNLSINLGELLQMRPLLDGATPAEATEAAAAEGWGDGFIALLDDVCEAVGRLSAGADVAVPLRVPVGVALSTGVRHALHRMRSGRPRAALWELALRPALVAVKTWHARQIRW